MSKAIQALFAGMLFAFFVDFFLFLGIKLHYINFYDVNLYYNILFADNQNALLYFSLSIFFGYLIMYTKNVKTMLIIIGGLTALSLTTLIPPIGKYAGEVVLQKKNVTLKDSKYTFVGDIIYDGRREITFYDVEIDKVITLNKEDLQ